MKKHMLRMTCAVALGWGLIAAPCLSAWAQDSSEKKKPSDRTVRVIMGAAFAALPDELKNSKGETVKLDKSDPNKFLIPIDDARRVIRKAVISARAELCGLSELERKHFFSIMVRERALKKWTSYQLDFIDHIHAATSAYMTGTAAVGDAAEEKDDPTKDRRNTYNCSDEERERVKAAVEADIKQAEKQ